MTYDGCIKESYPYIAFSNICCNILDSILLYYLLLVPRIYFITSIENASSCKIRYSLPENFLISSYNKETINTYELECQRVKND